MSIQFIWYPSTCCSVYKYWTDSVTCVNYRTDKILFARFMGSTTITCVFLGTDPPTSHTHTLVLDHFTFTVIRTIVNTHALGVHVQSGNLQCRITIRGLLREGSQSQPQLPVDHWWHTRETCYRWTNVYTTASRIKLNCQFIDDY